MSNIDDDDERAVDEWTRDVRENLVPKLINSGAVVSIVPRGNADVKFAVELGLSIMMDKPIIAVVHPGAHVPDKLVKVADRIVEADLSDPSGGTRERLMEAITEVLGK